jgi:hypothetical protein
MACAYAAFLCALVALAALAATPAAAAAAGSDPYKLGSLGTKLWKTLDKQLPEKYRTYKFKEAYDYGRFMGQVYGNCKSHGGSGNYCGAVMAWCTMYKLYAPSKIGALPTSWFLPDMKAWCLGEPTLGCCRRYDPTEVSAAVLAQRASSSSHMFRRAAGRALSSGPPSTASRGR